MEIKSLSKDVISKIHSFCCISNITQCVTELVLNSLDAESSAIAVRINTNYFRIQVVDNGNGISQENMENIARKYCTSKCFSLEDLDHKPKKHGYKGESLWSISNSSKTVTIISKCSNCNKTFSKNISNGKHASVELAKNRQSNGTTISIDGLFNNLPVRQKIIKKEFDLEEIVRTLKSVSIMNPQVSFSLRDDSTGKLLLKCQKCNNVIESLISLYTDIKQDDLSVMKVRREKIKIETLLLKEILCNKIIQHLFVNKRPVVFPILRKFLYQQLQKAKKKEILVHGDLHPLFVINIKCPLSCYDLIYEGSSPVVEFKNLDVIERCVEKMVSSFLGKPLKKNEILKNENKIKSICGASDLVGAIKGYGFKNWLRKDEKQYSTKENSNSLFLNDESKRNMFKQSKRNIQNAEVFGKQLKMDNKRKPVPIKIREVKSKKKKGNDKLNKELVKGNCTLSKLTGNEVADGQKLLEINTHKKSFIDKDTIARTLTHDSKNERFIENYQNLEKKVEKQLLNKDLNTTLFSNFTNTEDKGKDVIMYMFLKSTELYLNNANHEYSKQSTEESMDTISNNSDETILESKVFYENIKKTRTHQMNKTISVSVKVKRRRNESPDEKRRDIINHNSFTHIKPKRKKIENVKEIVFQTNLQKKDKATSPFSFNRKDRKYGSTEYTVNRNIGKIIQTTLSDGIESEVPRKELESYYTDSGRLHNYPLHLEKNIKQTCIEDPYDADYNEDIYHNNFRSFRFKPPINFDLANYVNPFRKEIIQNPTISSCIVDNIEFIENETKRFSDCNKSRLFHFKRNDIVNNSHKNSLRRLTFAGDSSPLLFKEKKIENNLIHQTDDTVFMSDNLPRGKNFDFENLSVSPIFKINAASDQMKISKQIQFTKEIFPTAQIHGGLSSLKKFADDGHISYAYNNPYWNEETYNQNEDRMKLRKKKEYASLNHFRKCHSEVSTNSRSLYIQKVKQNLDKLFVKPKSITRNNDQIKQWKEINREIFTKDSLENTSKIHVLAEERFLWKKFIEKKRNAKDNFDKNLQNKTLYPTKLSKIYFEKKTDFLNQDNFISRWKPNIPNSPDLFPVPILSDEEEIQKIYHETDLTFLPNSQPSCEVGMNFSLPKIDIGSKNKLIAEKENNLPTLTAVGNETLNFLMTVNENIPKDFIEQAIDENAELNAKNSELLSLHRENAEWIQKFDHQGNKFYFNTRTGMTNFESPQKDEGFNFKARPEFMPKGLSPLLMCDVKVDKNISPNSRMKLHDEILKSYENELDIVKWEKYLKENDPRKFFEEIYKVKRNDYENNVPNAYETNLSRFLATIKGEYKFSKALFANLEIIGQVDQKFIATIDKKYRNLILFDQHAVHERIRLEKLLREYEGVNTPCENITLFMNQNDMKLLKSHEKYLNSIGIYFRTFKNALSISKVPLCLYNKVRKEPKQNTWNLPKLVELLVQEVLKQIKITRGILTSSPKTIHQVIILEACRGAIKFGDCLTTDEMKEHIKNLSQCLLPFQCAHGRPTLVPILSLIEVIQEQFSKPQINRLKKI